MFDELRKIGIKDTLIDKLVNKYGVDEIINLEANIKNVTTIIYILKNKNIKHIDKIMLHELDLFYAKPINLIKVLESDDGKKIINAINEDYTCVSELMKKSID